MRVRWTHSWKNRSIGQWYYYYYYFILFLFYFIFIPCLATDNFSLELLLLNQPYFMHYSADFVFCRDSPQWAIASSFTRFLDHTQQRITVGRTPLDEWPECRRDLYLTTHNTHNRQTPVPQVGFEPTISAGERPQTYALDRAVNGTGIIVQYLT